MYSIFLCDRYGDIGAMKTKFLILFALAVLVLGVNYQYSTSNRVTNISDEIVQIKKKYGVKNTKKIGEDKIALGRINPLFKELIPPSNKDLEELWQEEYSCYKNNNVQSKCAYSFLNAKSLREAMWMKRNGYPSVSMMKMAEDPSQFENLKELIFAHHPAALVVGTIVSMERKNYKTAYNLAQRAAIYNGMDKTFPHTLIAQSVRNAQPEWRDEALEEYWTAALLGDSIAQIRASTLSEDTIALSSALMAAYKFLLSHFGNTIPLDERPTNHTALNSI